MSFASSNNEVYARFCIKIHRVLRKILPFFESVLSEHWYETLSYSIFSHIYIFLLTKCIEMTLTKKYCFQLLLLDGASYEVSTCLVKYKISPKIIVLDVLD